ncbi:MAG: cytochrome c oxidase subunit II [Nitrospirota bacterium]
MTTFAPQSDYADWIHALYLQVIGWDSLILLVVAVAMFLALLRYSTRSERVPATLPVHREHKWLEIAWTVGPAIVLVAIAIPTVRTTFRTQPTVAPEGALVVEVTGHQWWWEVNYPELKVVTANEIHVPAGRPVRFELRSADVIHSFWVPALGGKRDIIPGHVNTITATPRTPGVYLGQCAEFCGLSHANMRFRVFVEAADAFQAWAAHQIEPAAVPARPTVVTTPVEAGARLFATNLCVTCHALKGVATQRVGPDLTHFASRTTLAGGTLENTPANLAAWLRDPEAVKPGAQMPKLGLTDTEVTQLVAYLGSLK